MATSAYYDWVADGKPFRIARPVKEIIAKLRAAGVTADLGTIGNAAHLTVDRPLDHCPFSFTGWPLAHPYPVVTAIDYMHQPDKGMDCHEYFAWRLAEAKAGRTPWTKYLIWQAKRYDVRNNWVPVAASDHYDHIHESTRTDWVDKSIGAWPAIEGDDMSFTDEDRRRLNAVYAALFTGGPSCGKPVDAANVVNSEDKNASTYKNSVFSQLAQVRATPGGDVDEAALAADLAPLLKTGASPEEVAAAVVAKFAGKLGG